MNKNVIFLTLVQESGSEKLNWHLQNQESGSSAFVAAIVAVAVRAFTANAAQQATNDAHQHEQQCRTDAQQCVIHVNVVLLDICVGRVEMIVHGAR